jgi:hypothetical protein
MIRYQKGRPCQRLRYNAPAVQREQTYLFSPSQARNLIVNATHLPEPGRQRAAAEL